MKAIKIISILTIIILFSQCGSIKFEDNLPFEITSAVYENWTGVQPGVGGTNVKINYISNENFEFDSIYFSKKIAKLEPKKSNINKLVIGYFNTSKRQNELVLDENPTRELNNTVPNIKKFPFQLKENEAVVSYKINGQTKYYKIESLKKENSIPIPSGAKQ